MSYSSKFAVYSVNQEPMNNSQHGPLNQPFVLPSSILQDVIRYVANVWFVC